MNGPRTIVAEVSRTWGSPDDPGDTLSARFEHVIEVNRRRGYGLVSWRFSQVLALAPLPHVGTQLVETIVAVFERPVRVDELPGYKTVGDSFFPPDAP